MLLTAFINFDAGFLKRKNISERHYELAVKQKQDKQQAQSRRKMRDWIYDPYVVAIITGVVVAMILSFIGLQ